MGQCPSNGGKKPTLATGPWFFLNLFGLVALGVFASGWVLYFTDLFPIVGGLLGLGGLFAWIAFLSHIVSEPRKEQLQNAFDKHVLARKCCTAVIVLVGVGFWPGISATLGTIKLDAIEEEKVRISTIYRAPEGGADFNEQVVQLLIMPRSTKKIAVSTPWFGCRQYEVDVKSYAKRCRVEVCALAIKTMTFPDSFFEGGLHDATCS